MQFHEIANIFPLMDDDRLQELSDDIKANGLREKVVLFEGKVLDGRNRLTACTMAGVEPQFRDFDGDAMAAIDFVWSENFHRRHLDSSQRAMAEAKRAKTVESYAKAIEKMKAEAAESKKRKPKSVPEKIQEQIQPAPYERETSTKRAKAAGTNPKYLTDAERILDEAPDLAEKIEAGQMKITQAKLEMKKRAKREELKAAEQKPIETSWQIINDDCLNAFREIDGQSVRLIFADPPYNIGIDYGRGKDADLLNAKDFGAWCDEWIELCYESLTPDGSLWVMISDEFAAEIAVSLKAYGFHRRAWIKWYETFGVNCTNNFNRTSRHIFYCVKNEKKFVFHPEAVTRPSDRQAKYNDKRASEGGKIWDDVWQIPRLTGTSDERIPDFPTQIPLAIPRAIVACASDPGDTVLDPFNGSGSTGVAAIELRRHYIGIEWEERFCELSSQRLKGVTHGNQT